MPTDDDGSGSKSPGSESADSEPGASDLPDGGAPSDEPRADEPSADEPPADEPSADEPPADEPSAGEPTEEEVVRTAAAAAEELVFARLDRGDVVDYDVTVTFEDGILELDVFVEAPDATEDEQRVAEDAALAARAAVDDLFGE